LRGKRKEKNNQKLRKKGHPSISLAQGGSAGAKNLNADDDVNGTTTSPDKKRTNHWEDSMERK